MQDVQNFNIYYAVRHNDVEIQRNRTYLPVINTFFECTYVCVVKQPTVEKQQPTSNIK